MFAFDRDPKRLGVLKSRVVVQMGGSNVVPLLQDFLAVDPQDDTYSKVRHIFVIRGTWRGAGRAYQEAMQAVGDALAIYMDELTLWLCIIREGEGHPA